MWGSETYVIDFLILVPAF